MKDSKLIETLSILTHEQLLEIQQLLHSELLIRGAAKRECLRLFDYLMRFFPNFKAIDLDKKELMSDLFDDESGKINKLEKVMSSLLSAVEYYIIHFVTQKSLDEIKSNLSLVRFYTLNGFPQRGEIYLKRLKDFFDRNIGLSVEYHYWYGQYLEHTNELMLINQSANTSDFLEKTLMHNEIYSMIVKLDILCKTVYGRSGFDENTSKLFNEFLVEIERNEIYLNNILIKLYYLALKMIQDTDIQNNIHYKEYKELIRENQKHINTESSKILFTILRSFAIYCYNKSPNEKTTAEYMSVYREHLELGYLIVDGILRPNVVVNLILLAIKEKNAEWIYTFIQKWKNQIGTFSERHEILNFCWANFYFISNDFDKAEDYISLSYENLAYLLYTRRMRLKILFEKHEFLHLSYELDAFKVYVFRQFKKEKLTEEVYKLNSSFADFLKQIDTLVHYPTERKKERIKEKILTKGCVDKEWLLEKVAVVKV